MFIFETQRLFERQRFFAPVVSKARKEEARASVRRTIGEGAGGEDASARAKASRHLLYGPGPNKMRATCTGPARRGEAATGQDGVESPSEARWVPCAEGSARRVAALRAANRMRRLSNH